jgi:hypothetical protein
MPELMATRAELEKELRTLQEELRANKRSAIWGSLFALALALLFGPTLSLRSGIAVAIAVGFLALNGWGIVAGRQRIETLKRQLDGLDGRAAVHEHA